MKALGIKAFIRLNEKSGMYNTGHISDPDAIAKALRRISAESKKHPLNCDRSEDFDSLEPTRDPESDALTRELSSLDIPRETLIKPEITKLVTNILFNTLTAYYAGVLDDLEIESSDTEWDDWENGEGVWRDTYELSESFELTIDRICGESLVLRTYNLCLYFDADSGKPAAFSDGATPDGQDSAYEGDYDSGQIMLDDGGDLYREFEHMYDEREDELKKEY